MVGQICGWVRLVPKFQNLQLVVGLLSNELISFSQWGWPPKKRMLLQKSMVIFIFWSYEGHFPCRQEFTK